MTHYNTFRDQLAIAHPAFGYALWDPDPREQYPPVEVGDVGFIRQGKFHRLFNALLPANHQSHQRFGVPEYYEPLQLSMSNHIDHGALDPNNFCSYGVIAESGGSDFFAVAPPTSDSAEVTFSSTRKHGAALSLPVVARREDTLSQAHFGTWMTKHIDSWFAFSQRHGLGIEMEDIVLVTGNHRTRSWSNIAFYESRVDSRVSLRVQAPGIGTTVHWQVLSQRIQGAVLSHGPSGESLPENQCLFIRGFRVKRIFWILPRLKGAAEPKSDPRGNDREPETEFVLIPSVTERRDPLQVLLEYIATRAPGCDMALVHDDDLVRILGVGDLTSLETLQPDVVMDYLQKSKLEIGVMSDSWSSNNESPRTVNDRERMNVAMLSEQLHNLHRNDSEPIAPGITSDVFPGPMNESSVVDTGIKLESIPPDNASRHTFGLEQAQSRLLLSDVFSDSSGVIKGEQPVSSSIRGKSRFFEHPVVYHDSESRPGPPMDPSYSRPVITTPSADQSADGTFKDQTVLSRPASHSINIYTSLLREITASTSSLDLVPPPPTSERPGYPVHYTTIKRLNDDILLSIFDDYRLDDENAWNVRLGWRKLSQVCQRWRHLAYSSAFHLGMHIHCTNGTPIVETLNHLPPLPLFVHYRFTEVTVKGLGQDELGIHDALRLRDRVRRIDLHFPSSILQKFLMLMDEPFPMLEHLSLSSTVDNTTTPTLPTTFLAPNLRHIALLGIGLPKRLRLLPSTASVVTLVLTNIRASGYFRPRLLVARLQSLPQLEELSIGFSIPIPRPSTEKELLGKQGPPVTLPNLKDLTFQGVSAYLERIVAQIRAPLLERLDITLFNQLIFALPHLSHFTNITEGLKLPTANVFFERDEVSIITTSHRLREHYGRFSLRVRCKQLDWQIDCAAQVCSALMPTLSGVDSLSLDLYDKEMPTKWQNGEIDGTTWHELLRSFIGVKILHICGALSKELSRALEMGGIGSDPGLLPGLQELAGGELYVNSWFDSFIHARRVAGRPIRLSSLSNFQTIFDEALKAYKRKTKKDLLAHPLSAQLQSCDSPSDVIAVLHNMVNEFDQSSTHDERLSRWLDPTINVLYALSAALGHGVRLTFSPAKVIFAGAGDLLLASKDVDRSQETLVDLFERIENFFRRLEPYTEVPPTAAMTDMTVNIMIEVLNIFAIATKEMRLGRAKKFFMKLVGRTDMEDALMRLDRLTQEEARMAVAEVLRIAHSVRDEVKVVDV